MIIETYRITFYDGSTTLIHVTEDEDVSEKVADLCEAEGWYSDDVAEVLRLSVETPDEFSNS